MLPLASERLPTRQSRPAVHTRAGRITAGQKKALTDHAHWLLPADKPIAPALVYPGPGPLTVEIGCGKGEILAALAERHPENNYLGVEVYRGGVGSLLQKAHRSHLRNVRVVKQEGMYTLEHLLPENSLSVLMVFFSDPWPKKRHHKRRLINNAFLRLAATRLKAHGRAYLATDCEDYARHIDAALVDSGLAPLCGAQPSSRPAWRPVSRYEGKALARGRVAREWALTKP